ncbi:MAG: carbohydrate-binding family 9-like protein [Pyrinomonadaceae bacterium]
MPQPEKFEIKFVSEGPELRDPADPAWKNSTAVHVDKYWNGKKAPVGRRFNAKLLWSAAALYVRFEANQSEPLVVSEKPDLTKKTMGLWDRDVVEIFVAPDRSEPRKYFEFEAAPTGEWLDVALDATSGTRKSDWEYASGMEVSSRIEKGRVVMAMKIPWTAFGKTPKTGDVWLGNLLRCVGKDPDRGYLAWRPTMTERPNFHVPEAFGEFRYVR